MNLVWLRVTCFVTGFVIVSLETLGFRLLAPYFGSSVYVSGSVLGIVMLALSIGYYCGGALADRRPQAKVLYSIILVTSIWVLLLQLFHRGLMLRFAPYGVIQGSILSTLVAFGIPMVPLSTVSPYVIRLLGSKGQLGTTAGTIYSISTIGSLAGVFVTTFLLIPTFGVRFTIATNFGLLVFVAVVGLFLMKKAYGILMVAVPLCLLPEVKKPDPALVEERESLYGLVQVRADQPPILVLKINEGLGQSFYDPRNKYTYDYGYLGMFTVLPLLFETEPPRKFLLLGMGGGNLALAWRTLFDASIDIVEINQEVVSLAGTRFRFKADENMKVHIEDARRFLQNSTAKYDFIAIDVYQGYSVPFHLVTKEFFDEVKSHLTDKGMVAMNLLGGLNGVAREVASVLKEDFSSVYVVTSFPMNYVLLATNEKRDIQDMKLALGRVKNHFPTDQRDERFQLRKSALFLERNMDQFTDVHSKRIQTDDRSNFEELYFRAVQSGESMRTHPEIRARLLDQELSAWPRSTLLHLLKAGEFVRKQDRQSASRELRKVPEEDLDLYSIASAFAAEESVFEKDYEKAERILMNASRDWPDDPELEGIWGALLFKQGKYSEALMRLKKATSSSTARSLIWEHLGDAYAKLGKKEEARKAYQQALGNYEAEEKRKKEIFLQRSDHEQLAQKFTRAL